MAARVFGNAVDYINRKFDLLALRGARPAGDTLLDQTLIGADAAGEVCTGVQKLAQRWVLHFLTVRGSMRFLPLRGSTFMAEFWRGEMRTEADVVTSFAIAEAEIRRAMQNEETPADHPEEQLERATLLEIAISADGISLQIEVTSAAGTSRQVILPIPHLPIRTGF